MPELPREVWRLFDRIHDRGGRVCLASNNPMDRSHLREGGIEVFHPRSYVHLFLVRKPQRKYFEALLDMLGVTPNQVVLVGDDYLRDVNGPLKLGIRAYLVNPIGRPIKLDRISRRRSKASKILRQNFGLVWPIENGE